MKRQTFNKLLILALVIGSVGTIWSPPIALGQSPAECEPSEREDWEVYEGMGVTVELPEANWDEIDLEAAAETGSEFLSDEMSALAMFGSQQGSVLAITSLSDPALSLLVTVIPMPQEEFTVDNISELMGLEVLEGFGMIISDPRLTDLSSGEAYVIDVAFDESAVTLPISIFERFYLVLGEDNIYMVLFVTQESEIKDLCGDVAAIADSFTFDETMIPAIVAVADANWVTQTGDHVSIDVPDTWLDASDPNFIEMATELAGENNPVLQNVINQMTPGLFDLFLIDPVTGVTVNVIAQDLGVAIPIDLLLGEMETQYTQVLGAEIISIEEVEIPAGDALRAHITLDVVDIAGRSTTQEQVQVILLEGTWMYIISMGGPQALFEEYEPVFDRIAESLEIIG